MQNHRNNAIDQAQHLVRILLCPPQNLRIDDPPRKLAHRGFGQPRLPVGNALTEAEVSAQEMPSGAKHACHFGQELAKPRVVIRGLYVDHRVQGLVCEGQVFGVALHKVQAGQMMPCSAKGDGGRIQVQPRVGGGVQGAHQVGGSAAVTATDLQDALAAEVHLGRRAMVELDTGPIGFVGRRQRQRHRRLFLVTVIEEYDVLGAQPAGGQGVEVLLKLLIQVLLI